MFQKRIFLMALIAFTLGAFGEDTAQPQPVVVPPVNEVPKVSAFFVSILDPLPTLIGAGLYQQVRPNLRAGVSFGTNTVGYTNSIAYALGVQYVVRPGAFMSPVLGLSVASGELNAGQRELITYFSTGIDIVQTGDVLIGFGLNWSVTSHNG